MRLTSGLVSYFSPPNPIIHWYDHLTTRIHIVYDTDLKGIQIIRDTSDLVEIQFCQIWLVKILQNLTTHFNFDAIQRTAILKLNDGPYYCSVELIVRSLPLFSKTHCQVTTQISTY